MISAKLSSVSTIKSHLEQNLIAYVASVKEFIKTFQWRTGRKVFLLLVLEYRLSRHQEKARLCGFPTFLHPWVRPQCPLAN
jgi:hypothetical protein